MKAFQWMFLVGGLWMLGAGCGEGGDRASGGPSGDPGKADDPAPGAPADAVRLALLQARGDLPERTYEDLLSSGAIGPLQVEVDSPLSRELREGLVGSARYVKALADSATDVVRVDRYAVNARIDPFRLLGGGSPREFPFELEAGGQIEVARLFPTREAASAAPRIQLAALPISAESALGLPAGTVVAYPVTGRASLSVNGDFLSRAFRFASGLEGFLSASTSGVLSGTAQGTLLAEGRFLLQLVRLDGQKLRVRLVSGVNATGSGAARLSANGGFRYVYVPSAVVQRIRDLKEEIDRGVAANPLRQQLTTLRERVQAFQKDAPATLQTLFSMIPGEIQNPALARLLEISRTRADQAVAQAARADLALAELDRMIFRRADAAVAALDSAYERFLAQPIATLARNSDRLHDLAAAVELDGDFSQRVRGVADYVFDLGDAGSRQAFERAFLGRTAWLGESPRRLDLSSKLLFDLTLAEALAAADQGKETRRVERLASVLADLREEHVGLRFQALALKAGFDRSVRENRLEMVSPRGQADAWLARIWEFKHDLGLGGLVTQESLASGFFTPTRSEDPGQGAYWFAWQGAFGRQEKAPLRRSLTTALSFLGPLGVSAGIPTLYAGEHPGEIEARLLVVLHGEALGALFDPALSTDGLLWKAFGNLAETVDSADIGLPFMDTPFRPEGLAATDGAEQACEKVALFWGGLYCQMFQSSFVDALHAARRASDPVARLSFFEGLYRVGFLGNQLGMKLLVRYLAEVLALLGKGDSARIQLTVKNSHSPSSVASPSLEAGKDPALQLLESLDLLGLNPIH